jgi:hypothetical protein
MIFSPTDIISPTLSVTYPADTLITFGNSIVITGFATDQNGIKKFKNFNTSWKFLKLTK